MVVLHLLPFFIAFLAASTVAGLILPSANHGDIRSRALAVSRTTSTTYSADVIHKAQVKRSTPLPEIPASDGVTPRPETPVVSAEPPNPADGRESPEDLKYISFEKTHGWRPRTRKRPARGDKNK